MLHEQTTPKKNQKKKPKRSCCQIFVLHGLLFDLAFYVAHGYFFHRGKSFVFSFKTLANLWPLVLVCPNCGSAVSTHSRFTRNELLSARSMHKRNAIAYPHVYESMHIRFDRMRRLIGLCAVSGVWLCLCAMRIGKRQIIKFSFLCVHTIVRFSRLGFISLHGLEHSFRNEVKFASGCSIATIQQCYRWIDMRMRDTKLCLWIFATACVSWI